MAPAQLELFKFSLYVFFPIAAMLHFGDPDWYDEYVGPLRAYYTQADKKQVAPPQTPDELRSELGRLREERLIKREARLAAGVAGLKVGAGVDVAGKGKHEESAVLAMLEQNKGGK